MMSDFLIYVDVFLLIIHAINPQVRRLCNVDGYKKDLIVLHQKNMKEFDATINFEIRLHLIEMIF